MSVVLLAMSRRLSLASNSIYVQVRTGEMHMIA